jgi:hypothetical protein
MSSPLETFDDAAFEARRRRMVLSALISVAVMLLAAVAWLGSGSEPEHVPAAAESEAVTEEVAEDVDDAVAEPLPAVTYEVYLSRDPFEPVREPVVAAAADDEDATLVIDSGDADSTNSEDGSGSADTTDASGDQEDGAGAGSVDGCAGGDDEAVCNGHVVSLVDLTTVEGVPTAVIQVDTALYEVQAGDDFAERFRLLSIDREDRSVTAMYGDSRFTLRVGGRTLK